MKSLKSIVCASLEDQEVPGKPKVRVTKLSDDSYGIQITVEAQYADDVDEIALYDEIADSEYASFDISIDIVEEESEYTKFEYTHVLSGQEDDELASDELKKTDEELAVEADDLHVFNPAEDSEEGYLEYSDEGEDEEDGIEDQFKDDFGFSESVDNDYNVTWKDVEDFEKEYGSE